MLSPTRVVCAASMRVVPAGLAMRAVESRPRELIFGTQQDAADR
jgi:hypothetical protein